MTIPAGTKFHGVAPYVDTRNRKSDTLNANADAYTIEEIRGMSGGAFFKMSGGQMSNLQAQNNIEIQALSVSVNESTSFAEISQTNIGRLKIKEPGLYQIKSVMSGRASGTAGGTIIPISYDFGSLNYPPNFGVIKSGISSFVVPVYISASNPSHYTWFTDSIVEVDQSQVNNDTVFFVRTAYGSDTIPTFEVLRFEITVYKLESI